MNPSELAPTLVAALHRLPPELKLNRDYCIVEGLPVLTYNGMLRSLERYDAKVKEQITTAIAQHTSDRHPILHAGCGGVVASDPDACGDSTWSYTCGRCGAHFDTLEESTSMVTIHFGCGGVVKWDPDALGDFTWFYTCDRCGAHFQTVAESSTLPTASYADLPVGVRNLIDRSDWDRMSISEQRDWAIEHLGRMLSVAPKGGN